MLCIDKNSLCIEMIWMECFQLTQGVLANSANNKESAPESRYLLANHSMDYSMGPKKATIPQLQSDHSFKDRPKQALGGCTTLSTTDLSAICLLDAEEGNSKTSPIKK